MGFDVGFDTADRIWMIPIGTNHHSLLVAEAQAPRILSAWKHTLYADVSRDRYMYSVRRYGLRVQQSDESHVVDNSLSGPIYILVQAEGITHSTE